MIRATMALALSLAFSVSAQLEAVALGGSTGFADLVQSRVRATVGPQWVDIEEEAELGASRSGASTAGNTVWQIAGEITLPAHAVMTSCLLWNGDTLLMGKLRGQADAEHVFDSLVPSLPAGWPKDPLLIQQTSAESYSLRLYPVQQGGTRRLRLRYLVPVESTDGNVPVLPLLSQVNGAKPRQWSFELRGERRVMLEINGTAWPMSPPALRVYPFEEGEAAQLRWNVELDSTGRRALRNHADGGAWTGDYVLYRGRLPDSVVRKIETPSELVLLWRWIKPHTFFGGGREVTEQARHILGQMTRLAERGNKVGLVVDEDLGAGLRTFALGDSGSADYKRMTAWLKGLDYAWLNAEIPNHGTAVEISPAALELSRNRALFASDVLAAAAQFGKDTAVVQELLVVTAGPLPDASSFEDTVRLELPGNVSVRKAGGTLYGRNDWPGISLRGFAAAHPGSKALTQVDGDDVPFVFEQLPVTVSVQSDKGTLAKDAVLRRGAQGEWDASFNVHSKTLSKAVTWQLWGDGGSLLASWIDNPQWLETLNDSVVPRLWAQSEAHLSTVFPNDKSLAPHFGFVDREYSLLAIPSDTLDQGFRMAYADSGVPYLRAQDIFAKVGFKLDSTSVGMAGAKVRSNGFSARRLAGARGIQVRFDGGALGIVVRDLRGRVVARWSAEGLAQRSEVTWNGLDLSGRTAVRGVYLVTLVTAQGTCTASVALP